MICAQQKYTMLWLLIADGACVMFDSCLILYMAVGGAGLQRNHIPTPESRSRRPPSAPQRRLTDELQKQQRQ